MSRLALIHWSPAEAREAAARLRKAGHTVKTIVPGKAGDPRTLFDRPPDAVVIDLARRPSEGRDMGLFLRQRKATREVPLVFVGGDPAKLPKIRKLLPDAVYTEWRGIRGAIKKAIEKKPRKPAVHGVMAGYSGTPLPKKLGIKTGTVVTLMGAPRDFEKTLGTLPDDVRIKRRASGKADLVMLFVKTRKDLDSKLATADRAMAEGGTMWIAWPKKASGVVTDVTQTDVRRKGLSNGLVDFKICAIDDTWSGLRFSRRR